MINKVTLPNDEKIFLRDDISQLALVRYIENGNSQLRELVDCQRNQFEPAHKMSGYL